MAQVQIQPRLVEAEPRPAPRRLQRPWHAARRLLGQILIDMKAATADNMRQALAFRERRDARVGDILLAHGWATEADIMRALALQWRARVVDLVAEPPDVRLLDGFGAEFCLAEGIMPWRRVGPATVIVTGRPEEFRRLLGRLPEGAGPVVMALAPERAIHAALVSARQTSLVRRAETRVTPHESCRTLRGAPWARAALSLAGALAVLALLSPLMAILPLFLWAVFTLLLCTGLKALAFLSQLRATHLPPPPAPPTLIQRLPTVSVMVPLFDEDDIAPNLIRRLGRLDYPRELLDILLIVEEGDRRTQAALARHTLPWWMRTIIVPRGPIQTKPRALNFALDFCRGSIIGVYDAEDAPDPGQINAIVRRFRETPREVACLQGILDFYNARHNWLTRCFAVEYAAWFRVVLPGIARMGFVVPLGGTTLFFRREALVELGGWDAHNVTEDADLGVRLARHGYRTELVQTVTEEEPNGRALPWIRQRSRWLKGYAMTWAVHMRDPVRLWRDLGARRFFGFQIMFLGTLSQYLLAPVLWSLWLVAAGLPHPLDPLLTPGALGLLTALFLGSEVLNIAVGIWATRDASHRHLIPWTPTLHFYFPLGALASYKAFWELLKQPFFWDKTRHGVVGESGTQPDPAPVHVARLPVLLLTDPVVPGRVAAMARPQSIFAIDRLRGLEAPARRITLSLPFGTGGGGIEFQPSFEGF